MHDMLKEDVNALLKQLDKEEEELSLKLDKYREVRRKRLFKSDILKLITNDVKFLAAYYYKAPQSKKDDFLLLLEEIYPDNHEREEFLEQLKNLYYLLQNNLTDIPQYEDIINVLLDFREKLKVSYAKTSEVPLEKEEETLDMYEKARAAKKYFRATPGTLVIEDIDQFVETIELLKLSDEAKNTALMMAFINNNKVYKQDFLKQEEDEAKRKAKREKEKEKRESRIVAIKVDDEKEEIKKVPLPEKVKEVDEEDFLMEKEPVQEEVLEDGQDDLYQDLFEEAQELDSEEEVDENYSLDETAKETFNVANDFYNNNVSYFDTMEEDEIRRINDKTLSINSEKWNDLDQFFEKENKEDRQAILIAQVGRILKELKELLPKKYTVEQYNDLMDLYVDRLISLFDYFSSFTKVRELIYLKNADAIYLEKDILKDILPSHYLELKKLLDLLSLGQVKKDVFLDQVMTCSNQVVKVYFREYEDIILVVSAGDREDKYSDIEVKEILEKEKDNIKKLEEDILAGKIDEIISNNKSASSHILSILGGDSNETK